MVAAAMTETTLGEDTRSGIVVSQVGKERVQVRKAHSLIGGVYDPRNLARAWARVRKTEAPVVWIGSVLTGSSVNIGVISRCCINGWWRGVIVLCRCVGWRSTNRGRRLSVR